MIHTALSAAWLTVAFIGLFVFVFFLWKYPGPELPNLFDPRRVLVLRAIRDFKRDARRLRKKELSSEEFCVSINRLQNNYHRQIQNVKNGAF